MAYQIPQRITTNNNEGVEAVKLIRGILNKLTTQNNQRLLTIILNKLHFQTMSLNTLHVIAEAFHNKIIMQKTSAKLYCNFLLSLCNNHKLLTFILQLIWKQIDNQYTNHADIEKLVANYVLLIELFIHPNTHNLFEYKRLDLILCDLISLNQEWSWNIIYNVLIFHGVALHKLYNTQVNQYLISIEEAISTDKIHPTRLKYLLMDVKQHIRMGKSKFMNPETFNHIHISNINIINISHKKRKKRRKKRKKRKQKEKEKTPEQTIKVVEKFKTLIFENNNEENVSGCDDIVPAYWFGTENKREQLEELNAETALFCQFFGDDYKETRDGKEGSDGVENKGNKKRGNWEEFEIILLFMYIVLIHFVVFTNSIPRFPLFT